MKVIILQVDRCKPILGMDASNTGDVPGCHRSLKNAAELGRSSGKLNRAAELNCAHESARRAVNRNKKKQRILHLALLRGKEQRCPHRLLRKCKLQHLRVAHVRAASSISWMTWDLAGMWGAPHSCKRLDALS